MKTRILVAVIAIPVLVLVIVFAPIWCTAALIGVIAAFCAWELLSCTAKDTPMIMRAACAVVAFASAMLTPFCNTGLLYAAMLFVSFAGAFIFLMISFNDETPLRLEAVIMCVMAGSVLPIMLSSIVRLAMLENGAVLALLPFAVAFSSDSGGYFGGYLFGKHKLAVRLSPNKTIEGSIGGFVCAIVITLLYGFVLKTAGFTVNFAVMAVYGFLGSLACQLGDLSFSAIKRLCAVKDYGNLIPGHGGMLDRFDSMFWTAAVIEMLVSWVCAVVK